MINITIPQRDDETPKAYTALCEYIKMGEGRSLEKLQKARNESGIKTSISTLGLWSSKFQWQARVKQYLADEQSALAAQWIARQERVKRQDFSQARKLRKLADQMLASAPKFIEAHTTIQQRADGTIREITSIELKAELMLKAIDTASKLQRQATGLDTPGRVRVTLEYSQLEAELAKRGIDIATALTAMLDELKANEAAAANDDA